MYTIAVREQGDLYLGQEVADIVLEEQQGFLYVAFSNNPRFFPGDKVHFKVSE